MKKTRGIVIIKITAIMVRRATSMPAPRSEKKRPIAIPAISPRLTSVPSNIRWVIIGYIPPIVILTTKAIRKAMINRGTNSKFPLNKPKMDTNAPAPRMVPIRALIKWGMITMGFWVMILKDVERTSPKSTGSGPNDIEEG